MNIFRERKKLTGPILAPLPQLWRELQFARINFGRPQLGHIIKINSQTVDPEIYSILISYKRVWD